MLREKLQEYGHINVAEHLEKEKKALAAAWEKERETLVKKLEMLERTRKNDRARFKSEARAVTMELKEANEEVRELQEELARKEKVRCHELIWESRS